MRRTKWQLKPLMKLEQVVLIISCLLSGILTKPDLVDKGSEESMVDIIHNLVIPLKKGYMMVRCRGQLEITENISLTEATKREENFFKNHRYFQ